MISVNALNICLRDKAKVTLTESDGNKLFCVFSDGQAISVRVYNPALFYRIKYLLLRLRA